MGGLVPGLNLGTILGNGSPIGGLVSGLVGGTTGLSLGEPTDVPGIRISLAHAAAEAGGTKVMGATQEAPRQLDPVAAAPIAAPALPRTGGLPFDATGPVRVPDALVPVHCDVQQDAAVYVEPNIWVHHPL